jgi:hypothetical protein
MAVTRRAVAATLRRYHAEWQAALARRDYARTRTILGDALTAVSTQANAQLDSETRALHELLALDRRLQGIADGEAPARLPLVKHAFAIAPTRRFRGPWERAIDAADYVGASRVLRRCLAILSRRMAEQTRTQQLLIARLKRLQRTPLRFSHEPARCALCGGDRLPGVDSGRLFVCRECVQKASEILADAGRDRNPSGDP